MPKAPIVQVVSENGSDMLRVIAMALMNIIPTTTTVFGASYATSKAYGLGFSPTTYLWISVVGNLVAVLLIPFDGNLSDRIGRRPVLAAALGTGRVTHFAWREPTLVELFREAVSSAPREVAA